jgi:hypothetical protein
LKLEMTPMGESASEATTPCPYDMSEPTEEEWLRFAMAGGAFDSLADPREDVYTLEDGEPFVLEER